MLKRPTVRWMDGVLLAAAIALAVPIPARAVDPITIGFGMALTGGLAPNGKAALLAMQIWAEEINAKGGLLGRPVKLIYYDDQSNPATVPGLYTKLLDVDHVDLVISGYGTNMVVPALSVVMMHQRTFLGLLALDANAEFHYPNYFSITPTGPHPKQSFAQCFFEVALAQTPKPQSLAIVGADAEFARNAIEGVHEVVKAAGLKIVYDRTYPPSTVDFSSIVRAIQATNPDVVFVASYPPDTVGMVRAAAEVDLRTKLFGGAMVGLQSTSIKLQLGPLMNGIVNFDGWLPTGSFATSEAMDFLKRYQAKATGAGVDVLGYYLPPFAYADMQVLQSAVEGTNSLDEKQLADYLRSHTFHTVAGDITFGPDGEWTERRIIEVQFQNVKSNDLAQFADPKTEVILYPPSLKNGQIIYPYLKARE